MNQAKYKNKMANQVNSNSKSTSTKRPFKKRPKKARRKFLEVDVWRSQFGPVSEKAVYDVFSTKFNIESYNMKRYSFSHCLNALRRLEDPTYVDPVDTNLEELGETDVVYSTSNEEQ
tara:strand:+ start:23 stop:373 length:351 start_codon:yes stop_codon:yes gene_type:complete